MRSEGERQRRRRPLQRQGSHLRLALRCEEGGSALARGGRSSCPHHTSCSSSRAKRGREGIDGRGGGTGLGRRGEIAHPRLALLREEDGGGVSYRKGEKSAPSRFCIARGADAALRQGPGSNLEKKKQNRSVKYQLRKELGRTRAGNARTPLYNTCWASHTMGPPYVTPTPLMLMKAHILVGGRGENGNGEEGGRG